MSDISLTAPMRANVFALQQTADLMSRTQNRLATGNRVNSALDNPISFFTAQEHTSRATDLAGLKDAMNEAISTIKAADKAVSSLTTLIDQAKALGTAAKSAAKNQIKIQFSNVTAGESVVIGGATYTAVTGTSMITDPTIQFVATSDMSTTVANLAKLINSQDEKVDGSGTADMKGIAQGSTLVLEAKSNFIAITQAADMTPWYDVSGVTRAIALTNSEGNQVFSARKTLGEQYGDLMSQIDAIAGSATYGGVNLLNGDDLNVRFESSALNVKGFSATASDLGLSVTATTDAYKNGAGGGSYQTSGAGWGWTLNVEIDVDMGKLAAAKSTLQNQSSQLANNLAIIKTQSEFTTNMANTLTEGAGNLTLADMNEEGANMLMLQTRQSLSTTALSLASQAAQSVMRLFG
jgi:flagellin